MEELDEQDGASWPYVAATISTGVHHGPMEMGEELMRLRHVEVAIKALVKATPDAACEDLHQRSIPIHSPNCNPPSFHCHTLTLDPNFLHFLPILRCGYPLGHEYEWLFPRPVTVNASC